MNTEPEIVQMESVKNLLRFDKDAEAIWTQERCPVCKEVSGPKTKCYELEEAAKTPMIKRQLMNSEGMIIPILSVGCAFRQFEIWRCDINYPVSEPLILAILNNVDGIQKISAAKTYSFVIEVARRFNSADVIKNINIVFKSFIKEMQAKELSYFNTEEDKELNAVILPNGKQIDASEGVPKHVLNKLLDMVDNSRPVYNTKDGENR